jgi:hypothetical protein
MPATGEKAGKEKANRWRETHGISSRLIVFDIYKFIS